MVRAVGGLDGIAPQCHTSPPCCRSFITLDHLLRHLQVCTDLPMRHEIRSAKRSEVLDACVDLWDDYESTLSKMALKRDLAFARSICTEVDTCPSMLDPFWALPSPRGTMLHGDSCHSVSTCQELGLCDDEDRSAGGLPKDEL